MFSWSASDKEGKIRFLFHQKTIVNSSVPSCAQVMRLSTVWIKMILMLVIQNHSILEPILDRLVIVLLKAEPQQTDCPIKIDHKD